MKYVLLLLTGLMLNLPAFASDAKVLMLVDTCVGCHGNDGNSVGPATPSIAGMRESLFIKAMTDMKSGKRPSTVMHVIAKGYTDKEIALMAAFFNKQTFVNKYSPQLVEKEKARQGEMLHEQHCSGCHKINGSQKPLGNKVAGQWIPYLRHRLSEFRSGADTTSPVMASALEYFLKVHKDDGIEDILHYYGSQK
jgi:sulfide dehydrogenase cytochrome subunit